MTIYVDNLKSYPQKAKSGSYYFGSGKESAHMATDGKPAELHAFAKSIGLERRWFQSGNIPHYDLTRNKFLLAILTGATQVTSRELIRLCRKSVSINLNKEIEHVSE